MAISLTKGQRIEIGLNQVHVGLGWNPNQTGTGVDFDLDSSVFMLDTSGKIPNDEFFVFYNNQYHLTKLSLTQAMTELVVVVQIVMMR